MYAEAFFVLSMAAQAVWAGPAAATSNNPLDDVYTASTTKTFFSDAALPGPFAAGIVAQTPRDGRGVTVDVYMNNLPTEGGPFSRFNTCTSSLS